MAALTYIIHLQHLHPTRPSRVAAVAVMNLAEVSRISFRMRHIYYWNMGIWCWGRIRNIICFKDALRLNYIEVMPFNLSLYLVCIIYSIIVDIIHWYKILHYLHILYLYCILCIHSTCIFLASSRHPDVHITPSDCVNNTTTRNTFTVPNIPYIMYICTFQFIHT